MTDRCSESAPLVGRAFLLPDTALPDRLPHRETGERAIARYREAVRLTRVRYEVIRAETRNPALAATLAFHLAILQDPELDHAILGLLLQPGTTAAAAVNAAYERAIEAVGKPGGYIGSRADDFREVRDRVLERLGGSSKRMRRFRFQEPTVVVLDRLSIEALSRFDRKNVVAVVCAAGGTHSHAAIVLAADGIPLILDPALVLAVRDGETVAVTPPVALPEALTDVAGFTLADGSAIQVLPLINGLADTVRAGFSGFTGIGLVRTEFLFHGAKRYPSVDAQYRVYRRIVAAANGRRTCFRLFDVAFDKPAFSGPANGEGAAFLVRRPAVLDAQLEAILRTAAEAPVDILVPRVEDGAEISFIRARLALAQARIAELTGTPPATPAFGIMIETKAAADVWSAFPPVDFVSIGSNDLAADLFGVTREDGELAGGRFCEPAFLAVIATVVAEAKRRQIEPSLCGAAADDPAAIAAAVAVGIRRFIPSVHAAYTVYPRLMAKSSKN